MLYILVRIITFLILGCVLVLFRKKIPPKTYRFLYITAIILAVVSVKVPVESLFLEFKTPESACKYLTTSKIQQVDIENNCAVVFFKDEVKYLEKGTNGWKLPRNNHAQQGEKYKGYAIVFNQSENNNIIFLCVEDLNEHQVSDSMGTTFQEYKTLVTVGDNNQEFYSHYNYAFVNLPLPDNYSLLIDGTQVPIS